MSSAEKFTQSGKHYLQLYMITCINLWLHTYPLEKCPTFNLKAIKAGLRCKAVQVYHTHITTTYSSRLFNLNSS